MSEFMPYKEIEEYLSSEDRCFLSTSSFARGVRFRLNCEKKICGILLVGREVYFTSKATDELLSMPSITELRCLAFNEGGFHNTDMSRLLGAPNLKAIRLQNHKLVSDLSIQLAVKSDLEDLSLVDTSVSMYGVEHLRKFDRLRRLTLVGFRGQVFGADTFNVMCSLEFLILERHCVDETFLQRISDKIKVLFHD